MSIQKMTEAQRLALRSMAAVPFVAPSEIGYAMTRDRPYPLKAQGAGRVGASMAIRLIKLGWVEDCSFLRGGFPAYRITGAGRAAVAG
jgi:hypothetical protein